MSKFPDPLQLPSIYQEVRRGRLKQLMFSIGLGLLVKTLIILMEFSTFWVFGGESLLLDAISSLIDLGSSLCLLLFIWIASKPPDSNHPFGHGRLEPIAGLQLSLFLALMGAGLFFQQLVYLFNSPAESEVAHYIWIVPLLAVILLEIAYQRISYVAKKENSPALKADAIHYRIDAINSGVATLALFVASYFPDYGGWIDRIGALMIAFLMLWMGLKAAKENFYQLTDRRPESEFFDLVKKACLACPGVLGIEKVRIQMYGPDAHIDVDIEINPLETVEKAHRVSQVVRRSIQEKWPQVRDVTVHIEPYYVKEGKK